VGKEDTGADDAEECGECIQHGKYPKTQRIDLTAQVATQSKEFRDKSNFESGMMILCNSCVSLGQSGPAAAGRRSASRYVCGPTAEALAAQWAGTWIDAPIDRGFA
jgi:hypothetical protein